MKITQTPEYVAWQARRDECLRIGHEWEGQTCKHCGADKHGKTKQTRKKD